VENQQNSLANTYGKIRPSIVSIVSAYKSMGPGKEPDFPNIIGTGFLVAEGLVATNYHVLQAAQAQQAPAGASKVEYPFLVSYMYDVPGQGVAHFPFTPVATLTPNEIECAGYYYGPIRPDIALIKIPVTGLPVLKVSENSGSLIEGESVATAGFPLGTDTLTAPGYLHQLTPTLQAGIISAVLPFPCESPHAFMIDVMALGGASGSPVFMSNSPAVVGVLYGGLLGPTIPHDNKKPIQHATNLTYAVPSHFLSNMIKAIMKTDYAKPDEGSLQFDEILNRTDFIETGKRNPGAGMGPAIKFEGNDEVKAQ